MSVFCLYFFSPVARMAMLYRDNMGKTESNEYWKCIRAISCRWCKKNRAKLYCAGIICNRDLRICTAIFFLSSSLFICCCCCFIGTCITRLLSRDLSLVDSHNFHTGIQKYSFGSLTWITFSFVVNSFLH